MAVAGYTWHGLRKDTENQFARASGGLRAFMGSLMTVEIGAWLVLVAGFVDGQFVH